MNATNGIPKSPLIPSPLLAGVVFAAIWLAAGALLLSLMLQYSGMKESSLPTYAMAVHGLSALAGGFVSGKRSGYKGWYYGGMLGGLYGLLILLISFLAVNAGLSTKSIMMLIVAVAAGAVGGMIGVNAKK
ncbi:TIGR04086 family membrane protein [Paenibacillus sp. GCM10023252]|uniref:TIGR04086 family membrane protein n=1 Tax=Paenibacillus sp. GCM10023252 TaxID=3252649 RepID=UPI0036073EE9